MRRLILVLLCATLLMGSLLLITPNRAAFAQEENPTTEVQESNSRGPGAVILMIGIAALAGVGAFYSLRRENTSNTEVS